MRAVSDNTVIGHWVIRSQDDQSEVHRIACHYPKNSSNFERAEAGMYRKVDFERFYLDWEDA